LEERKLKKKNKQATFTKDQTKNMFEPALFFLLKEQYLVTAHSPNFEFWTSRNQKMRGE